MNEFAPDEKRAAAGRAGAAGAVAKGKQTESRVLCYLALVGEARVKDVAGHIGHTDASAHRHLSNLVARGLVGRRGVRYVHGEEARS